MALIEELRWRAPEIQAIKVNQGECTTRQRLLKRRGSADCMEAGASIKVNQGESR